MTQETEKFKAKQEAWNREDRIKELEAENAGLRRQLCTLVEQVRSWNQSVEKIIGRQPAREAEGEKETKA